MDYEIIVPLLFSISHFTGFSHAQCPLGNYGSTCELKCGQCAGDGSCDQITGSCVGGCNPGYTGSKCDGACPSTCGGDGSCLQYPPYCSNGCQAGYTGLRCDQVTISTCPLNCLEPCGTYDCPSGCLPGYYGFDCSVRCSCSSGVACEQISGVCEITTPKSSPSVLTTTYGTYIVIHYVDESGVVVANNSETTTLSIMPSESLSFYTTAFWVPVALLSLVMALGCIRTIWKLYARKRKNNISSYESRFVLSEEINVAYDRLTEPDNIYIELERMPTITSFSDNRGGSQYYSTVASLRDHAKFRSDNRALADQVILEEGVIPDEIETSGTTLTSAIVCQATVQRSLSFYVAVFWVPIAVLSLVMVIAGIRTIWRLHDRKRKATLPFYETYESRFVLSEGDNVAYDKINEPENVYLELNGMSTTASSSTDGEGNQYYSTVGSIRDHAKFRSDNRALADPASSREGIISDEIETSGTTLTSAIVCQATVQRSLSFYVAVFWVPIAVLSLVMVIAGIRTIWRLHDRKRKATLPFYETYESRFVLSEGDNVAYDKINEPENVYLELNGMSTTASSSTDGEGNQYYSTVGSIRDHAKFRSDNRALADPASSREGIISDGQPQRVSEANAYLYLIP
uniref:Uncharacterized protein n=1 Tax=Magallana gigas TaxID=29159 RepID=A0A8W8MFY3_MAGGI